MHVSFIRSIGMDAWSDKQLKGISLGGNKALADFLAIYDLVQEATQTRYLTKAVEFYRERVTAPRVALTTPQLRSYVEGTILQREAPSYEEGRSTMLMEQRGTAPSLNPGRHRRNEGAEPLFRKRAAPEGAVSVRLALQRRKGGRRTCAGGDKPSTG